MSLTNLYNPSAINTDIINVYIGFGQAIVDKQTNTGFCNLYISSILPKEILTSQKCLEFDPLLSNLLQGFVEGPFEITTRCL